MRPAERLEGKTSKSALPESLSFILNPDILTGLNALAPKGCFKVGFALAHGDGKIAALRKLKDKGCDMIVLNSITDKGAGFGHTTNRVDFVHGPDRIDSFELKPKEAVAKDLADVIEQILLQQQPQSPSRKND
jgi:phosphopantothenoylcysteine decarboxylase/phosphopantothenate--cysteine ligase